MGHGKGSRGGTPGKFILRYMARASAVENIAPTRLQDTDPMLQRYDTMEKVANEAISVSDMKEKMYETRRQGGLGFGDGDPAMSDAKIKSLSKEMQRRFDSGKTAIETVISFDEDYLRANGVLDSDFLCEKRGDFVGHVDQLKLRLAIMHGIDRMKHSYDDLHYAGVIHVDTEHVHCHLTFMDFGIGTIASDGMQKGKINPSDLKTLRRGIDMYLDAKQDVKMMSSSVSHDRQNVLGYVKKFTHQTIAQQGLPQFLLACLPENRNLWSANSNRVEMRKANALVRDFVVEILQPTAGAPSQFYQDAHRDIIKYADARQEREGISDSERLKLIRQGEERIITDCMNGVYRVLKDIPKEKLTVRTPILDMMSMDYDSLAAQAVNDPSLEFGLKLRSYSSRLKHHRKEYHKFRDEHEAYEQTLNKSADAEALAQYLAYERDYQQRLMVKYQHFLGFLPANEDFEDEFEGLMQEQEKIRKMDQMTEDSSFQRMGSISAEQYGLRVYGISNGNFIKGAPEVWKRRVEAEKAKYHDSVDKFRDRLHDYGFDFDGSRLTRKKPYEFDEVKMLDLHHLGYDFPYEAQISKRNVDRFVEVANRRHELFQGAKEYLERTGQKDAVHELDEHDVVRMKAFADQLQHGVASVTSKRSNDGKKHHGITIPLGRNYVLDMEKAVQDTVHAVHMFE